MSSHKKFFLTTERIGFSHWSESDLSQAMELWGNPEVTRYICASGRFTPEDVRARLERELSEYEMYRVQYFPIYVRESGELIGCCGLHPHGEREYELGFHLRPEYWHQGLAAEAAQAMIRYAFEGKNADALFAGHNPENAASKRVLMKLGFQYIGDEYYEPTGLYHPSYRLEKDEWEGKVSGECTSNR